MAYDIFLIIAASIIAAFIVACMIVFVWFYQHPDDYWTSYFYKLICIVGLSLSCMSILLMPMDVANQADVAAGHQSLPMDLLWLIDYIASGSMILFLLPFLMYYYESDGNVVKRFFIAFAWQLLYMIVAAGILAIFYAFLGFSDIPVTSLSAPFSNYTVPATSQALCPEVNGVSTCVRGYLEVTIQPTIVIYIISFLTWIGWVLFVIFGGVGMTALPMDLINDWRTRPKTLRGKEGQTRFIRMRTNLRDRAKKLLDEGKELKSQESQGNKIPRRKLNAYRQKVMQLEYDHDYFDFYIHSQRSPIVYWVRLILGILGILIAIAWMLQILLYILIQPPVTGLLNLAFIALDNVFPLFGTLLFCLFVFYLIWAVIKGTMKFGLRLLIITVHPMKFKGTHMNSFMFNTGLVIMASFAVMQFCTEAFSEYARFTSINIIYGNTARYLRFLKYFYIYNIYIYALLGFAGLSLLYLIVCTGKGRRQDEMNKEFERLRDSKV